MESGTHFLKLLNQISVEVVEPIPAHRYSVDFVSYSSPSGILSSGRKQNTTYKLVVGRKA